MKLCQRKTQKLLILALGGAAFVLLEASGLGCPFYRIFGIICPGCGMTRALFACLRLDFAAAWHYHPMVFSLPYLAPLFWKDGKVFQNRALNILFLAAICAGFFIQYFYKLLYLQ